MTNCSYHNSERVKCQMQRVSKP